MTLLSWFELHTPSTHQDRADLADAIETLKVVNRHVQEVGIELSPLTQSCNGLVQEVGIELFPLTLFFKKKKLVRISNVVILLDILMMYRLLISIDRARQEWIETGR